MTIESTPIPASAAVGRRFGREDHDSGRLAALLAREHKELLAERATRERIDTAAKELAVLLAHARREVDEERRRRERAEAIAAEMARMIARENAGRHAAESSAASLTLEVDALRRAAPPRGRRRH